MCGSKSSLQPLNIKRRLEHAPPDSMDCYTSASPSIDDSCFRPIGSLQNLDTQKYALIAY